MVFICFSMIMITTRKKMEICDKYIKKEKKTLWPLFMDGFNCLKPAEALPGGGLLFTTKFPEIPGTHFFDLGRMKG